MAAIIGKTAAQFARALKNIISQANREFNQEGPPNPKVIQKLKKNYSETKGNFKKINQQELRSLSGSKKPKNKRTELEIKALEEERKELEANEYAFPITPAKDKKPVMERGKPPSVAIGAGEDAYSKGTTPFRPKDEPVSETVSEGRDTGTKGHAQKARELTIKGDRSVRFKFNVRKQLKRIQAQANAEINKEGPTDPEKIKKLRREYGELKTKYFTKNDRAIEAFKGEVKKVRKGEATFKKPRKKPSSVDNQKKAIVRQGKKELAKDPLNPNTSKVKRLRKQYETLNNLSNEVVDLVNESDLKKQTTEANRLKKLVGRYTTTQINDIMGSSGDFSKRSSTGNRFSSSSRGDGKYIPRSDEVGAPYPSPRANPEQVALKRKRPRKNRSQIIKKAQDAPVALQNLLVKLGIIKRSELKSSYVSKNTKTKPYKPTKPKVVRKGTKTVSLKEKPVKVKYEKYKSTPTPVKGKAQEQREAASKARNLQQKSVFNKIKTLTPLIKKNGAARYQKRIDSINKDIVRLGMQRDATLDSAPARYRAKDLKVFKKKGGKVLKAKPKRKVTTIKRKTTAPRKRAALRGYGKALRGF